ncbi:MAG: hypothetical protein QM764_02080 [Chitinophagaceae bacterium]
MLLILSNSTLNTIAIVGTLLMGATAFFDEIRKVIPKSSLFTSLPGKIIFLIVGAILILVSQNKKDKATDLQQFQQQQDYKAEREKVDSTNTADRDTLESHQQKRLQEVSDSCYLKSLRSTSEALAKYGIGLNDSMRKATSIWEKGNNRAIGYLTKANNYYNKQSALQDSVSKKERLEKLYALNESANDLYKFSDQFAQISVMPSYIDRKKVYEDLKRQIYQQCLILYSLSNTLIVDEWDAFRKDRLSWWEEHDGWLFGYLGVPEPKFTEEQTLNNISNMQQGIRDIVHEVIVYYYDELSKIQHSN